MQDQAEHHHQAGIAALQAGANDAAITHLRNATEAGPKVPRYWANLGEALRRAGLLDESLTMFERSVQLDPDYANGWRGVGAVRFALRRIDAAENAFRRWLALGGDRASALAFIADCARMRGAVRVASERYREALAVDPRHRHSLLNLPQLLVLIGDDEAAALAAQAVAHWPGDVEVLISHGQILKRLERFEEAMDAFADAWDIDASSVQLCCLIAETWEELGDLIQADLWLARAREMDADSIDVRLRQASLLRAAEQPDEALAIIDALAPAHPGHDDIALQRARTLFDTGDAEGSIAEYRALIARQPNLAAHDIAMAHVQIALGDLDGAVKGFRSALSKNPRSITAVSGLAMTLRAKLPEHEAAMLRSLLDTREMPDSQRAQLLMGTALIDDGNGRHEQAATAALASNRLYAVHAQRRQRAYDAAAFDAQVDAIIDTFSAARIDALRGQGNADVRPTFIIAMPRSGTTLTEQILDAHPLMLGVGERPFAERALQRWSGGSHVGDGLGVIAQGRHGELGEAARWHLDQLDGLARIAARAQAPQRIVDKMPDNYQWAGFIHAMFPHARLIHLRRDPRDIAVSNWMNLFSQLRWTNDLDHIAGRLIGHHRLMQHWQRVLPAGVLIEIDYAQLAAEPETQARRLIAALGMEWDPACLDFHLRRSLVRTASVTQVREPVHSRSVERWRPYEQVLRPLIDQLLDAGVLDSDRD